MSAELRVAVLVALAVTVSTPWWLLPALDRVCDAISEWWQQTPFRMFGGRR